jgi:pimeloyl-ACP methyl ester carboxylesterase
VKPLAAWVKFRHHERARVLRTWSIRVALSGLGLCVVAAAVEELMERRAQTRLMAGETFADVNGARIRYRMLGAEHTGNTVVLLSGLGSSIEQMRYLQPRLASAMPTLSYDRAGYGFSEGSHAHTADDQATELKALLDTLPVLGPVVLVGFSSSALLSRVFAARYPARTAGIYLVEPDHPEFEQQELGRDGPHRMYARWILYELFASTFGLSRLRKHPARFDRPKSIGDEREEETLRRRPHIWALAREAYELPTSFEQALRAPVGSAPLVILSTAQGDPWSARLDQLYSDFVRRSPRGKMVRLPHCDHGLLFEPGPALDAMVEGITELATGTPS